MATAQPHLVIEHAVEVEEDAPLAHFAFLLRHTVTRTTRAALTRAMHAMRAHSNALERLGYAYAERRFSENPERETSSAQTNAPLLERTIQ
jgi:hypothetical protein